MKRCMRRVITICLCFIILLSCSACTSDVGEQNDYPLSQLEKDTEVSQKDIEIEKIPIAVTDFSVRLLQAEMQSVKGAENDFSERLNMKSPENQLLSPVSVLTVLSMLGNGAKNETRAQIEEVLGVSIEDLNIFISNYMKNLPQEENKFHMVNSIWFTEDERFTVKETFINNNKEYYNADVFQKPFDNTTVSEVNQWVEEHTDGLIKDILDEIPKDAVMYLINALVFDAKWEVCYEESNIREGIFTTVDSKKQNVDMMFSSESVYLEDENATGFVKYYKGREYAFVGILPNENITLSEYINTLSGDALYDLLLNTQEATTHVWIPQLKVEYKAELKNTLKKMGIIDAFDMVKADLSDIGTSTHGNLYVNRVIHKTYMDVSPVGTKAGAATVVEVRDECAIIEPLEVKEVCLDRPFLYMIIDCEYNQPIFIGTVNQVEVTN